MKKSCLQEVTGLIPVNVKLLLSLNTTSLNAVTQALKVARKRCFKVQNIKINSFIIMFDYDQAANSDCMS